jgi:hypothetical protein
METLKRFMICHIFRAVSKLKCDKVACDDLALNRYRRYNGVNHKTGLSVVLFCKSKMQNTGNGLR